MWGITIEKVDNGFIIREVPNEIDDDVRTSVHVIEEIVGDDEYQRYKTSDESKILIAKLLEFVAEFFGESEDRWKKDNLNIEYTRKGSKADDE